MEKVAFTREELYQLVWSKPMLTIAKQYVISDTGIRKMCLRLGVPTPYVGYWRQIDTGNKARKKPLPQNFTGKQTTITLVRRAENAELASPITILKRKIEIEYADALVVPEHFRNPHPLIIEAKKSYKERDQWQTQNLLKTGVYHSKCRLNLAVAPRNVNRSLRFLDTFIKLMMKRGHTIEGSSVIIHGNSCSFSIDEILEKDLKDNYFRTGRLNFQIRGKIGYHKISDGVSLIESKLSGIVATIEDSINRKLAEEIESAKRQERWREEQRIENEKKEKISNEIKQFQQLIKNAKRFQDVTLVRQYLLNLATSAVRKQELDEELMAYIEWGKKKCNWYEPGVLDSDPILVDSDRDKIEIIQNRSERRYGDPLY